MEEISSTAELNKAVALRLKDLGMRFDVGASGPITASVAFVSTAPGPTEMRTKMPFSGGAGSILWSVAREYGWNRNSVYVTNLMKTMPQSEESTTAKKIAPYNETALWREVLLWELSQLPMLQHILILGGEALEALTGKDGVLKHRGSLYPVKLQRGEVKSLVTVNPALIQRYMNILQGTEGGVVPLRSALKVFKFDLHKFNLLTKGQLSPYVITHHINPTFDQAMDYMRLCASNTTAADIEVMDETLCVGLAHATGEGMSISFINPDFTPKWSVNEEMILRRALNTLLSKGVVAQNGMFDALCLGFKDKIRCTVSFDTLLAHHLLYPGLPHSLAFLTSRYTTHPFYKDDKDGFYTVGDLDAFLRYNIKDACITLACKKALALELERSGLLEFFYNHVMRLHPELVKMSLRGIKVDTEYMEVLRQDLEERLAAQLKQFHSAVQLATDDAEYRPNPLSPKQMGELFFQRLRLVGRGAAVDEANRTRMLNHPGTSEQAKAVIVAANQYIAEHKFYSVYAAMEPDDDGRMRTVYKQSGTTNAPGRLSSEGNYWGTGGNLQNVPKTAYPMFIADPHHCLFYFDLEQAEARVVAWLANIPKWIEDFERARATGNYDCHRALAADMWSVDYSDVPIKDEIDGVKTIRYTAKRCRHGLNYRMGIARLAETTGLPLTTATDAYHRYHRLTPELQRWWKEVEHEVRTKQMIYNLYGRRWVLTEPITENSLKSIIAFKPQSTIGDKVARTIYLCHDDPMWPRSAHWLLNIHDALLGVCTRDQVERVLSIAKKHAEEPLKVRGMPDLIIPASCKYTKTGASWRVSEHGHIEFKADPEGYHRWSDFG